MGCRTSMCDRRGLSTSKAWLNNCQVENTRLQPSIRWDARSYQSVCTNIFNLSIKLRSLTCTSFPFCTKTTRKPVSICVSEIRKSIKFKANKSTRYHPTLHGEIGQESSSASQLLLNRRNSLTEFLLESGRHDMSF